MGKEEQANQATQADRLGSDSSICRLHALAEGVGRPNQGKRKLGTVKKLCLGWGKSLY